MKSQERFVDTGDALTDMATQFIVHCPECGGKAIIQPEKDTWKLKCSSCFHVEKKGHWYGALTVFASVKCRECNASISRSAPSNGHWKKIMLRCNQCGDECEYDAHVSTHPIHDGFMTDPVFGLRLWLQDNFRDDIFWAYNYDHLTLLKDYISAKLRERGISPRNTIRKNSSMISRLPAFIRKAGNRKELLKLIEELETKE